MRKKAEAKLVAKTKQVRRKKYEPADFIDEICIRLSDGETLRSICRSEGMPSWDVVYVWANGDDELAQRIARAREAGYDAIAMEALEIADTPKEGVSTVEDDKGVKEIREDMLGHRKLQVETRLKLLAKWSPQKYGAKQEVRHSGAMTLEQLVCGSQGSGEE